MRRLIALILLAVFLFNTVGYYALYQAIRSHSHDTLLKRLDNDQYKNEETVTLKLPLAIPYQTNTDYQRVDGSFEHLGEYYKLVKQKIENDTLLIVCYRDKVEKKLSNLLTEYVKVTNDIPSSSKSAALKLLNSFSKDYEPSAARNAYTLPCSTLDFSLIPYQNIFLTDFKASLVSPPPEA